MNDSKGPKVVQYGNPVLESKSEIVKVPTSKEIKDLVEDMYAAMKRYGDTAAGLSAPQIGISKKVTVCRRLDLEERSNKDPKKVVWEVMINPEYISKSKEMNTDWEGCLSINNGNLFGRVERHEHVEVKYVDLDGVEKTMSASGYFAHVVQHEIDHLEGVLFLRYIENPEELLTSEELSKR
ncbi:MAG: peptide deformylase [Candidatus Dojkabacteria bacterium]